MGKVVKTSLGRALLKHQNNLIKESKVKGKSYRSLNKKVLNSVTDVSDIDAALEHADQAFSYDNSVPHLLHDESNPSTSGLTPEERIIQQKKEEALHAGSLRVPRRPPWNAGMTVDELDVNEKQAFLAWRRGLAKLEQNENLVLTPFEKNLNVWRQLWRVVERSDLLVVIVDARDPMFYRCPDLETYVRQVDEHKRTMLLVNKADLLPYSIRMKWANYFHDQGILFLFWSAKAAFAALEGKKFVSNNLEDTPLESEDAPTKIYGRDELLDRLQSEAEEIRRLRISNATGLFHSHSPVRHTGANPASDSVTVGFVGYPNVGKSSTINALIGEKRAGVTSTPGKTKHFQTLIISNKLTLCDCPGLVFPSFTSSRHEMIALGVLSIDKMTNQRAAVQVVADKVPRRVIEEVYKITLPKPKPYESQSRPPLASELLRAYCASRGYAASSGLPDETRAARQILKDYINGKLAHYAFPPGMSDEMSQNYGPAPSTLSDIDESDSSDIEVSSVAVFELGFARLEDVMNDLNSFNLANGLAKEREKAYAKKKLKKLFPKVPQQLLRRPQRKKCRLWRLSNDGGDCFPVVQSPLNTGALNA